MASRGFDPVRTHSEKLAYVNHCLRVINARPTLNIKPKDPPKSPAPVRVRSSSFHARERKRVVDAENERLLKKLTTIDNRPSQHPTTPSRSLSRSSSNRTSASRSQSFTRFPSSMDRSSRASSLSKISASSKISTVSKYSKATSKPESTASSSAHVRKSFSSSHSSTVSTASSASKSSDTTTSSSSDSTKSTMSRDSLERKEKE